MATLAASSFVSSRVSLARALAALFGALVVFALSADATAQVGCSTSHARDWFPSDWGPNSGALGSVAISGSGNRAAMGASTFTYLGTPFGAVWVMSDPTDSTSRAVRLRPSVFTPFMSFGATLAFNWAGDVLVVGAPRPSGACRVFVFRYDGVTWSEEWYVAGPIGDDLGASLSMNAAGDLFVAGAPGYGPPQNHLQGLLRVYRRGPSGWSHEASLAPTDVVYSHAIGVSVALSADGRFIAASTNAHASSGAIYIFEHTPSGWVQAAKLFEPVAYSAGGFGKALTINADGTRLAAGNVQDGRLGFWHGAVTVFNRNGAAWSFQSVLLPGSPIASAGFGTSLDMNASGDRMVVGAPGEALGPIRVGMVEEFECVNGNWQRVASHVAPTPEDYGWFGRMVSCNASGDRWGATENRSSQHGHNFGEIHFFEASCLTPTTYCTAQANTLGCTPAIEAQGTPSLSSSNGFRIAARNVRNQQNGMLLYGGNGRAATPWLGGTLCVQPPLRRTPLANSGGSAAPANDCSGALVRDFNAWAFTAADPVLFPGQHVRAQFYSRDPGASHNVNLSDAIEFYLEP